jgi:hypothetical protein
MRPRAAGPGMRGAGNSPYALFSPDRYSGDPTEEPLAGRDTSPEGVRGAVPVAPPAPPLVLTKVEALLKAGKSREAVILAYRSAEDDVIRAFSLTLPKQWTHREFIRRSLRPDMGYISVILPQLHAIFEPVRFGTSTEAPVPLLTDLMRALYQEPALRRFLPSAAGAVPGSIGYGYQAPPPRPVPNPPAMPPVDRFPDGGRTR